MAIVTYIVYYIGHIAVQKIADIRQAQISSLYQIENCERMMMMINEFRMNINNTEVAVLPRIALIYFMTLLGRASKYYFVIFPHSQ